MQADPPKLGLNEPAGQAVHAVASLPALIVPTGQETGPAVGLGQYSPGSAEQVAPPTETSQVVEPATLVVRPAAQAKHAIEPVYDWKVPIGHSVHEDAFGVLLYEPAGHVAAVEFEVAQNCPGFAAHSVSGADAVQDTEPSTLLVEPGGHAWHAAEPIRSAYVPTGHTLQNGEPAFPANVPAGHIWQRLALAVLL